MNNFDIDTVLKISKLTSELEFERASALESRLRWMMKKDPSLKEIPVIYFSANSDIQTLAQQAGADTYLPKPFDLNDLEKVIESALL